MLTFRNKDKSAGKSAQSAGKELQKLKRQDLLELLLEQMREADRLRVELAASQAENEELEALADRLKAKLNDKDAQLDHLKARLDDKDVALQQVFSIIRNMAVTKKEGERLSLLLEAEDVLADRYLHQVDEPGTTEETQAKSETAAAIEVEPESEFTEELEPARASVPVEEALEPEPVATPIVENITVEEAEPQSLQSEDLAAKIPPVDILAPKPEHIDYLYVDSEPIRISTHSSAEEVR